MVDHHAPALHQGHPLTAGSTVGVDIGGTKILAVRLGPDGRPEEERRAWTPAAGEDVVAAVAGVVGELTDEPAAIGVGIPGLVDTDGVLCFSPHLPGLVGVSMAAGLASRFPGVRTWFGNDATAAGWAEHDRGAGTGAADMLMVTLGTGIGGGLVTGGRLAEGAHRFAGELGHMVVDPHGPLCPCGQRGCWERFASGSGLGLLGREAAIAGLADGVVALAGDPEAVRGEHVTRAAAAGDGGALAIVDRFAWWLALGLANLANVLDPAVIVLGGGIVDAGEVVLGPARRAFLDLVEAGRQRPAIPIRLAELGSRAGAVGAALLAA